MSILVCVCDCTILVCPVWTWICSPSWCTCGPDSSNTTSSTACKHTLTLALHHPCVGVQSSFPEYCVLHVCIHSKKLSLDLPSQHRGIVHVTTVAIVPTLISVLLGDHCCLSAGTSTSSSVSKRPHWSSIRSWYLGGQLGAYVCNLTTHKRDRTFSHTCATALRNHCLISLRRRRRLKWTRRSFPRVSLLDSMMFDDMSAILSLHIFSIVHRKITTVQLEDK